MTGTREKDLIIIGVAVVAVLAVLGAFLLFRAGYGQSGVSIIYQVENATEMELLVDERRLPRGFDSEFFTPEGGWDSDALRLYPAGRTRQVTITAINPLEPRTDRFIITALAPGSLRVVFQKIYEIGDLEENGAIITVDGD